MPNDQDEEGKAQLTRWAAYEMHKLDPNIGLLEKTSGNNVYGLSTDVIVHKITGDYADIATTQSNEDGTYTVKALWLAEDQ